MYAPSNVPMGVSVAVYIRRPQWVSTVASIALLLTASLVIASPASASPVISAFSNVPNYGYAVSDSSGNVFVSDYNTGGLTKVATDGTVSTLAQFSPDSIWGMTINAAGDLFVADWSPGAIYEVTPAGVVTTLFQGSRYQYIYGMAVDGAGNLYTSTCYGTIIRTTPSGNYSTFATGAGGCGLAFGPNGTLYSSDGSSTVYAVSPQGAVSPLASNLLEPYGLAYDTASGLLYVAQYSAGASDAAVVAVSANGAETPVVAQSALPPSGGYTYSNFTIGTVALDPSGNLWLGDWNYLQWFKVTGVAAPLASPAPTHLVSTRSATSMTVSWQGGSAPYTCTLLYGFGAPSTFTVRTSSSNCTFYGLDPATSFGVRVTSYQGASATIFSNPVRTTITCVRSGHIRHVSGFDPRCPSGWHQRG